MLTDQPCTGWNINFMLPKVGKHNRAHELFMNTYGRRRRSTAMVTAMELNVIISSDFFSGYDNFPVIFFLAIIISQ